MSRALESAGAKIVRVMGYFEPFENSIAKYRNDKPFEIVTDPYGNKELKIFTPPPIEISILAGEGLYHLRSALDHLFFELVERNLIGPLRRGVFKTCQFPLYTEVPDAANGILPVDRKHLGIPYWVPDRAYAYIEGLQPYHRRDDRHRMLRFLIKLSNIDKHRRLNTTVTRINRRETFKVSDPDLTYTVTHSMLDDGTKIGPVSPHPVFNNDTIGDRQVHVQSEFIPQIAFDEPEIGPPQTVLLNEIIYDLPLVVWNIFLGFKELLK